MLVCAHLETGPAPDVLLPCAALPQAPLFGFVWGTAPEQPQPCSGSVPCGNDTLCREDFFSLLSPRGAN